MSAPEDDPFSHTRMSLGQHLAELRSRLFKGLSAVVVAFFIAWALQEDIQRIVMRPYDKGMGKLETYWVQEAEARLSADPELERTTYFVSDDPGDQRLLRWEPRLQMIAVGEGFFFLIKICIYFAVFAGSPVLLYQLWQFVAAGLYAKERGAVRLYFPASLVLFMVGVLFGYYLMVPNALYYLNRAVPLDLGTPNITVQSFLTFISSLCMAFGLIFQLPLLLSFLGGAGLVDPKIYPKYRGHFMVGSFVIGALLTPPDPFTQVLMAGPLIVLYEIGSWCARIAWKRGQARRAGQGLEPTS